MPRGVVSRASASSGSAVAVNHGRRRGGEAAVAEEEAEGVGVQGTALGFELDRLGDQRQLEPVGVGGPEVAEHIAGLEDAVGPAPAAVGGAVVTAQRCSAQHRVEAPS